MPNYAQATIMGHLGKDPETRGQFTSASVAVTKNKKGTKITTWWRVSCYGKDGEAMSKLSKGDAAMFVGEPEMTEFTNRDGVVKQSLELSFARVTFIAGRGGNGQRGEPPRNQPAQNAFDGPPLDDDIPFVYQD